MTSRGHMQPYMTNSVAIRQEIQRFESVHPSIYAIYDLIDAIPDQLIQQQIREHVVCIEDSFVNSQEWTISRSVGDLKLGILGTIHSGKSALVHRYLTGSYMQEESPEGGRFKKEVVLDGQSYLLLIRDEGGPPEMQFTHWVDAVIFVFSLENELSFHDIYSYYAKMARYRNISEVPVILVGTQDAISESNPRVIDDTRARKLASDLKRCSYYETCATYGLNVERVFQDACQKVVQLRVAPLTPGNSRPNTPNHSSTGTTPRAPHSSLPQTPSVPPAPQSAQNTANQSLQGHSPPFREGKDREKKHREHRDRQAQVVEYRALPGHPSPRSTPTLARKNVQSAAASTKSVQKSNSFSGPAVARSSLPASSPRPQDPDITPNTTPNLSRKHKHNKSFIGKNKGDDEKKVKNGEVGSGRSIPTKQGYLYKKSGKPLNKDWKKKYVALLDDGRLTYHPSLHDYMDDVHGKEINLVRTTVKIPGQRPRAAIRTTVDSHPPASALNKGVKDNVMLTGFDDGAVVIPNASVTPGAGSKIETPNVKKRHKRVKSSAKNLDNSQDADLDGYEFVIVSLENKQWNFEAPSIEEREDWVGAIEQQILSSLQMNESNKVKGGTVSDPEAGAAIRSVKGNAFCADCDAPNPDWASLNLGAVICIECSGIHRNLGTHLSRVRSLDLDEWPPELVDVMLSIGNHLANNIWEANAKGRTKPSPTTSREDKERYIRSKYEHKELLPNPPYLDVPLPQQLIDAVARQDVASMVLVLAHCQAEHVNAPYSKTDTRTALHIATALGNVVLVQLLLWNGADVRMVDHEGRNALWYARSSSSPECVHILRNQGCPDNPTLPRRRSNHNASPQQGTEAFEKLPASVI